MIYFYLKTDGEIVKIETEKKLRLETMQDLVAGGDLIEFARLGNITICMDEEGLIKESDPNPFFVGYEYVGDLLLGHDVKTEGDTEFRGFDEFDSQVIEKALRSGKLPQKV